MTKTYLHIIVGVSIVLTGLSPASGFSLLGGKPQSVNRWPYSFGDRYIYDNGGSSWNYGSGYRYYRGNKHAKHRHLRFMHGYKRPINEKLDGLIKHLTRHSSRHYKPFHPAIRTRFYHIGRQSIPEDPLNELPY